jgi:capsular exopolysaccharide synthesis family protein
MSTRESSPTYALEPATRQGLPLLAVLRRRAWVVVLVTLLAGGAAAAFAYVNRNSYASTAQLLFRQTIGPEVGALGLLPNTPDADNLTASNVQLIKSRRVADATARELGILGTEMSAEDVEKDIAVSAEKDSDVVKVTATATSARRAALLATVYARQGSKIAQADQMQLARRVLRNMSGQLSGMPRRRRNSVEGAQLRARIWTLRALAETGPGTPTVIQSGFVPTSKTGDPVQTIILGVLFGVVLGVGLALLREQADRRLHRPEDVSAAFDAPVLTTVPRSRALKRNAKFAELPPEVAEAFRMLQMNLRFAQSGPVRSVLVTSSRSREGKTTIAWNLASAAATGGLSVALVEADLRRPSVAERYDLEPEPGLTEALQGDITIAEALQPVIAFGENASLNGHQRRFSVVVAGSAAVDPWALMQSDAMGRVLDVLEQHHDLVVVDTPPIPHVADAISLVRHVDGVVVVASVNSTSGPEARRLRDQLQGLDARVLGVVANGGTPVTGYGYSSTAPPAAAVPAATGNGRPEGQGQPQNPAGPPSQVG